MTHQIPRSYAAISAELERLRSVNAELLAALEMIRIETMDFPPVKPYSSDSYLPPRMRAGIERVIANARGE